MKIVILDTNVLLSDPKIILSFPDAEVAIPEVVLGELDKIKVSRTDADVRFRGREVSRIIFELSEHGNLTDGVDLPDGGTLRIIPFSNASLPEGMSTRTTDDKILACAWQLSQVKGPKDEVTLVTNDLNMLLKAQTLGLQFEQWDEGGDGGWSKKYVIRPFQRYKVPLAILAVALAVFAGVFFYAQSLGGSNSLPSGYKTVLSAGQIEALQSLQTLERDPQSSQDLLNMGNFYYEEYQDAVHSGSSANAMAAAKNGIDYYGRYLAMMPEDVLARTDMAALQFYNGQTDQAIQNIGIVLETEPNNLQANYNLGLFYLHGRRDFDAAIKQFEHVMELTEGDTQNVDIYEAAKAAVQQAKQEQKDAGSSDAGTSNTGGTNTGSGTDTGTNN